MTKKLFIVTGEQSGDIHASNIVKELKKLIPDIDIAGVGGNEMKKQGVNLIHDHSDMGIVGIDSLKKIPEHIKLGKNILKFLKNNFKPDLILLIDYGGFNIRLAKYLKKNSYKIFYYIAPQVWATRKGRLKKIARYFDKVMLIFPFEEEIHKQAGVNAEFVGHPLVTMLPEAVSKKIFCEKYNLNPEKPLVGIFPGSRKAEIHFMLEILLNAANLIQQELPDTQFILAQATNISDDYLNKYLQKSSLNEKINLKVLKEANYEVLSASDMLLLTSGTVTLEAAIYQTPMLLSYKSYSIAYWVYLLIRYIDKAGLPNIIMGREIVKEFIQDKATPDQIATEALRILKNPGDKNKMLQDLADVKKALTNKPASVRVSEIIFEELNLHDKNS
jgi:lipid-A-disaccharide synthase